MYGLNPGILGSGTTGIDEYGGGGRIRSQGLTHGLGATQGLILPIPDSREFVRISGGAAFLPADS